MVIIKVGPHKNNSRDCTTTCWPFNSCVVCLMVSWKEKEKSLATGVE